MDMDRKIDAFPIDKSRGFTARFGKNFFHLKKRLSGCARNGYVPLVW
jgi:hypothetical protein